MRHCGATNVRWRIIWRQWWRPSTPTIFPSHQKKVLEGTADVFSFQKEISFANRCMEDDEIVYFKEQTYFAAAYKLWLLENVAPRCKLASGFDVNLNKRETLAVLQDVGPIHDSLWQDLLNATNK